MIHYCDTIDRSDSSNAQYKNRKDVEAAYPAAEKIVAVVGGYAVFDTHQDYETWRNQR